MNNYCQSILRKLESDINEATTEIDDQIELAEFGIKRTLTSLSEIKNLIIKLDFSNQIEEIEFFKKQKPKFLSKLIYYNTIYKIAHVS